MNKSTSFDSKRFESTKMRHLKTYSNCDLIHHLFWIQLNLALLGYPFATFNKNPALQVFDSVRENSMLEQKSVYNVLCVIHPLNHPDSVYMYELAKAKRWIF